MSPTLPSPLTQFTGDAHLKTSVYRAPDNLQLYSMGLRMMISWINFIIIDFYVIKIRKKSLRILGDLVQ
ncbi:hypothetical protein [uncultured Croceitalea sp.]|uniref:hypothetical protein n=1 Tax=uncultured Croceitalea sp. TaxID=1798908 RepID=UPI003305C98C